MGDEGVHNETIKYCVAMLRRIEIEMVVSQSSMLAVGFLDFDAARFAHELDAIKQSLALTPTDFPETHPESFLEVSAEEESGEPVVAPVE